MGDIEGFENWILDHSPYYLAKYWLFEFPLKWFTPGLRMFHISFQEFATVLEKYEKVGLWKVLNIPDENSNEETEVFLIPLDYEDRVNDYRRI